MIRIDFCVECLDSFIRETLGRTEADGILSLGFTVRQLVISHGAKLTNSSLTLVLNSGLTTVVGSLMLSKRYAELLELIRWTKGFGAPNIEGHDVAAMFKDALVRLVSWFASPNL